MHLSVKRGLDTTPIGSHPDVEDDRQKPGLGTFIWASSCSHNWPLGWFPNYEWGSIPSDRQLLSPMSLEIFAAIYDFVDRSPLYRRPPKPEFTQ